jgi:hypothetical protein
MTVSNTLARQPARALGTMLLVAGLTGRLLAGAAGSAAALQSAVMPAAGSAASPAILQPGGRLGAQLQSVRCTSSSNCWAVGVERRLSEALHWNGQQWALVSTPSPARTVALHWNGSVWSVVPTPSPGGTAAGDSSDLLGVTCVSSADCWAVGSYSSGSHNRNLVLHLNGTSWSAA